MALSAFSATAVDDSGNTIALAEFEVRRTSDNALATLYADAAGTALPGGNPATADENGQATFYVDPDQYDVTITGGSFSKTYPIDLRQGALVPEAANRFLMSVSPTAMMWRTVDQVRDTLGVVAKPSRAALITWLALSAANVPDGGVVWGGKEAYQKVDGATAISAMPDFVPFGWTAPQHFSTGSKPNSAAINAAFAYSKDVRFAPGLYEIDGATRIPEGCTAVAENGTGGRFLNNDDTVFDQAGVIFEVTFGAGIDDSDLEEYYANAAITLASGSEIQGITFWYPNQDLGAEEPTAKYPPAISTEAGVRGCTIRDINVGNSYVGIDITRDNSGINLENISGYPLWRGFIHGSAINPGTIRKLNFNANRVLYGSPWISPNIAKWVMDPANGAAAVELRRTTWAVYKDMFAYGYSRGVIMTNGAEDPENGINLGGSPQNCTIQGGGFDTCPIGILGEGFQGRINVLFTKFTPTVGYGIETELWAVKSVNQGGTVTDFNMAHCEIWAAEQGGVYLEEQHGSKLHHNHFYHIGRSGQGTAFKLVHCLKPQVNNNVIACNPTVLSITGASQAANCVVTAEDHGLETGDSVRITEVIGMVELNGISDTITVINDNSFSLDSTDSTSFTPYIVGGDARVLRGCIGIDLVANCSGAMVSENHLEGFDSFPMRMDATDRAHFINNRGEDNLVTLLTDIATTKKYDNEVWGNKDDLSIVYGNDDVDSGLLQFNRINRQMTFGGTAAISALPHGYRGQMVSFRITGNNAFVDNELSHPEECRLQMGGNFSADPGDIIRFESWGPLGWFEATRSSN